MIRLSNCPNNCVNGWKINPYTHKRVRCEFCATQREVDLKSDDTYKNLRLPLSLTNGEFIPDTVFSGKDMEEDSVEFVKEAMTTLIGDLSIGELPSHSMLFNLGRYVHENNFLNPLVLKAYKGGIDCLPVLTSLEVVLSRRYMEIDKSDDNIVLYNDMLSKGLCVVTIDAGETHEGVLAVKGLMQLRARNNLPTIIITHLWNKHISSLYEEGSDCYNIATLYSIKYKSLEQEVVNNRDTQFNGQLSKKQFEAMRKSNDFI